MNILQTLRLSLLATSLLTTQLTFAQQARPTNAQLAWHDMEYYWFMHFGPNTFTGKEWGHGDEPENIFNPTMLDCMQWCRLAKASGAKGIIITAKHHDGFCLWPSNYSTHTVRESAWKNGKGDVLKALSEACKWYGLKFGVYISPWDRNHPQYGTPEYNTVFVNMMKELFTNYGPIWELWWDGANGEGPNGKKQVYDWHLFESTVRQLSPQTIIFSDIGPDCRWVGNERGIAGTTNWNYLDTAGFKRGEGAPPNDTLQQGNRYGEHWIPAECDVSIRPGWFYHEKEDSLVKTPDQLFSLYLRSVGRGANLLLNVPPDRKGLVHEKDSASLSGFYQLVKESFSQPLIDTSWMLNDMQAGLTTHPAPQLNCIALTEDLVNGQGVSSFSVSFFYNHKLVQALRGTTIGHKRILTFSPVTCDSVVLQVQAAEKTKIGLRSFFISEALVSNPD